MVKSKTQKLVLNDYGSYLGMEKGCFIVKDRHDNVERYPLFEKEISEVVLKSGNSVSTGALASLRARMLAKFLGDERKTWTPRIAIL